MEYKITMPYIGGILSENSYKFTTRGTRPFVKFWMKELAEKVSSLNIPKVKSYEVQILGKFTDERHPDISNLFKVTLDAIEDGLFVNDRNFKAIDKGCKLGFIDPELEITIIPQESEVSGVEAPQ